MIASDIEVRFIRPGDVVLNPHNQGQKLFVRSVADGMYDLTEIAAVDADGQQHLLRVPKDSTIKIVEEA